jgi:hypothetical protein
MGFGIFPRTVMPDFLTGAAHLHKAIESNEVQTQCIIGNAIAM